MAAPSSDTPAATIYLLRHGAMDLPALPKRYIGCLDIPLSARGRKQALYWAKYFSAISLDAIHCSPLGRCLKTAQIIGTGIGRKPQIVPDLKEIDLGTWEGVPRETIKARHPEDYRRRGDHLADYRPPSGESFRDLQARAWPAFRSIADTLQGSALVVTHAGIIRVLLCKLIDMPLANLFRIEQPLSALTIVVRKPKGYALRAMNLACTSRMPESNLS